MSPSTKPEPVPAPTPLRVTRPWPYRFGELTTSLLVVDTRYQRPLSRFFESIVGHYNGGIYYPLVVSKRDDGTYAIIDGQTRHAAGLQLGFDALPCLIYEELSVQQEAALFVLTQTERKNLRALHRFLGQLVAGDTRAVEIAATVERNGLELVDSSGANAPADAVSAIVALEAVYERGESMAGGHGGLLLDQVLKVLLAGWPGQRGAFTGDNLRALAAIVQQDDPDLRRLGATLTRMGSPHELAVRSAAGRTAVGKGMGGGSFVYTANAIRAEYRHRWRTPK